MPHFPSKNILAKDVIGEAFELVAVEEARVLIKAVGISFYNWSIAEIQNLLGYIDAEALMKTATIDVTSPLGNYKSVDISALGDYDKIVTLEITNDESEEFDYEPILKNIETFALPIKEFLRHKANMLNGEYVGALHPHGENAIYTIVGGNLQILWGENITINNPACTAYFTRQPIILTKTNYDSTMMDLPDKYAPLLANRIAAYAEMRQGISDKAMAVVKNSYNQLLAPLDPQKKAKIMDSFQFKPTFTPNETDNRLRQ
jgi:hypothetical protein